MYFVKSFYRMNAVDETEKQENVETEKYLLTAFIKNNP